MTDVVANVEQVPAGEVEKHVLNSAWCVWVNINSGKNKKDNWNSANTNVHTFNTVEDFWCLYNNLSTNLWHGDMSFFKEGIQPAWEDPVCKNGGRWVAKIEPKSFRMDSDNSSWLNLLLALIGEQTFQGSDNDLVCGAVLSSRAKGPLKVALWVSTTHAETLKRLGTTFGEGLRASLGDKVAKDQELSFELFAKQAYTQHLKY